MRNNPTLAERKLWYEYLRNVSVQFLRQRPIDNFIVDFYCPKLKLVIEIDGETHLDKNENILTKDIDRTKILENYGLKVLRFWNNEVLEGFDLVCDRIETEINNFIPPNPI